MALPVKKLYFDSRFKTKGSASNSQCKFELSESISLPNNCVCYIDDVIIPHSFFLLWRIIIIDCSSDNY